MGAIKLDGEAPLITDPPPTISTTFSKKKIKKWHVTADTWHMTCDMWHVTCDMRHMVGDEHSLKISAPQLLRIEHVLNILNERIIYQMNEWMRDGGDCRTAPATPGLVIIITYNNLFPLAVTNWTSKCIPTKYRTETFWEKTIHMPIPESPFLMCFKIS